MPLCQVGVAISCINRCAMHFVVQNEMQVIVTHLDHTFEVHEGVFNIEPLAFTKLAQARDHARVAS